MTMDLLSLTSRYSEAAARLRRNSTAIDSSVYQLSSGNRFRYAADDVANISIASKMMGRTTALRAAAINATQASSLLQVADGGLAEITNILQRMNAVAAMAGSGTLSQNERSYLNMEYQQLMQQADSIATTTKFNDIQVLTYEPTVSSAQTILGTIGADTLSGGNLADTITGYDSGDIITAGAGNDEILSGAFLQPGLRGSVYLSGGALNNLAAVNAFISANTPNAQFVSTAVDYPNGAVNSGGATIAAFLGTDAATLTVPAVGAATADRFIVVFDGFIDVATAGNYSFDVGSDDGFSLSIDGNLVSQFPNIRGFAVTPGNATLSQGRHSFQLIYWENAGGNGVELNSSLTGGGILDSSVTLYGGANDGNDTINGESGDDVVVLSGSQSNYTITQTSPTSYQVQDNRFGNPDGTDTLTNVERLRFGNGTEIRLYGDAATSSIPEGTLRFDLGEKGSFIDYEIVNARTNKLFDNPASLNVMTSENAAKAVTATQTAIDRATGMRAYVGSKATQANLAYSGLAARMTEMTRARAAIADTDIAVSSTSYAQQLVQRDMNIAVQSQADLLRFDSLTLMISDAAQVLTNQGSGSEEA